MQGRNFTDPPAIVAEAELEEHQLVEGIIQSSLRDNFAVGRYALQWHQRYRRSRSDAALARMVQEANPDCDISDSYIQACRYVARKFTTRVGTLSWSHHRVAVDKDAKNAEAWLAKTEKGGWSVLKLQSEINSKLYPGNMKSKEHYRARAKNFREIKKHVELLANTSAMRMWLGQHADLFYEERQFFKTHAERAKKNLDRVIAAIDKHPRPVSRKGAK